MEERDSIEQLHRTLGGRRADENPIHRALGVFRSVQDHLDDGSAGQGVLSTHSGGKLAAWLLLRSDLKLQRAATRLSAHRGSNNDTTRLLSVSVNIRYPHFQ